MTVVDPGLPPYEGPSEELQRLQGGHQLRAESNGHAVFHQMDDLIDSERGEILAMLCSPETILTNWEPAPETCEMYRQEITTGNGKV